MSELKAHKADVTIPVYGTIADADVYLKEKADEAIAELKKKLEDVQASHYAESVDAGMRERRLKRALWLARAERAMEMAWNFHEKNLVEKCAKWDNVHLMLLAKAEEYK